MSNLARLALLPLIWSLAACGGKSSAADDTGSGGSGTGGTGHGATGPVGGAGGGSAGSGSVCNKYDDEAPTAISVMIVNKTDAPIYLGQEMMTCGVAPLFEVADARGGKLPSLGGCRASCVGLRTQGQAGCPSICQFPTSVALQPGEQRFTNWTGLYRVPGEVPAACAAFQTDEAGSLSCDMAKRVVAGTYTFSARAGTSLDCSQTSVGASCSACTVDGEGGCTTSGSLIGGKILTAQATVELNQSYGVYGGDAEAPAPGGNSGATANLAVELVFTNP